MPPRHRFLEPIHNVKEPLGSSRPEGRKVVYLANRSKEPSLPRMKGHEDGGTTEVRNQKPEVRGLLIRSCLPLSMNKAKSGSLNHSGFWLLTFWLFVLRKEVIQPQVPLRLPCYDFTPVAEPTVAGCLPCGLAHRLRVNPTPMV